MFPFTKMCHNQLNRAGRQRQLLRRRDKGLQFNSIQLFFAWCQFFFNALQRILSVMIKILEIHYFLTH